MSRLELQSLTKSFADKTVLHPLDLHFPEGSFVALLGASGCGKTTLLRMIAGLEEPSSGSIRIGDETVDAADMHIAPELRNLGMVFQSYAVWPHLNVLENVRFPLEHVARAKSLSPEKRDQLAREAIAAVHLQGFETRTPSQLSGGQQQRVALARALAMKPRILLLDEPLSNLDARLRAEMRRELKALHRATGLTMILVTHDQKEAFELADRVILLKDGKVEQDGTPADLQERPATEYVRDFLAWH
jgi:ABC-type Fe3+/spermidine/putrescine transport system ATPase subunit